MTIFAIDFDGTCVQHAYPQLGPDVPGAASTLLELNANGHQLILWTMRSNETLQQAVSWFRARGIKLFGINNNPDQKTWTNSPKQYANVYIDDAALGMRLIYPSGDRRPYVDWRYVRSELKALGYI